MSEGFAGGGPPTERAGSHIESAVAAVVIQAFIGAFSQSITSIQTLRAERSIEAVFSIMESAPGILTIAGWAGATIAGGPFGLFGFPIGAIGGSMMMPPNPSPMAGFFLALFGGTITWIGVKIGGWRPFL